MNRTTARHTFLSISPVLIGYSPSSNFSCLLHYRARTSLKALFEPHVKFYFCGNACMGAFISGKVHPLFQAYYATSCSIHSFERSVHSKCEKFSLARMELQTGGMFKLRSMSRCLIKGCEKTVRIGGNGGNERSSDRALAVVQVRRGREATATPPLPFHPSAPFHLNGLH